MRLWSIHPKYLDTKGLVALWREGLLAREVLEGKTEGYKNHPQLVRFQNSKDPIMAINTYLFLIFEESKIRGFHFDASKLSQSTNKDKIPITGGQIEYEFKILRKKLRSRSPEKAAELERIDMIEPNPIFCIIEGDVESWEKTGNIMNSQESQFELRKRNPEDK